MMIAEEAKMVNLTAIYHSGRTVAHIYGTREYCKLAIHTVGQSPCSLRVKDLHEQPLIIMHLYVCMYEQ